MIVRIETLFLGTVRLPIKRRKSCVFEEGIDTDTYMNVIMIELKHEINLILPVRFLF